MEIPEQLIAMFSGRVEERDGAYVVEIPKGEIQFGNVDEESVYQVALLLTSSKPEQRVEQDTKKEINSLEPPVEEGRLGPSI
jgi:hypothetical protein